MAMSTGDVLAVVFNDASPILPDIVTGFNRCLNRL